MKNSHDFQYKIPTIFNFVQKNAQNKALYTGATHHYIGKNTNDSNGSSGSNWGVVGSH